MKTATLEVKALGYLIPLFILLILAALVMTVALVCFFIIFYSPRRKPVGLDEYPVPPGDIYEPFHSQFIAWTKDIRTMEHRDVSILSHDGLVLRGKYFEYKKGAPMEILFHGYRGTSERDLGGGVYRCFALGRNALIVDHRGSGTSDSHVITFGIKESLDCLRWVDFAIKEIDPEAKIILTGISMGASTVMTASGMPLPKNVVGILADCGFTSAKAIIQKVMKDMGIPGKILYPFIRLGARIFGGFDPEADSAIAAMERCYLPILFFHGDADAYVPAYMSEENLAACVSAKKRLVKIKGAGHGLCFPCDQATYLQELGDFFAPELAEKEI